ncbi:MAG: DpnD/PcfM family protein [Dehalococcoidales bacterium]|nr:DpnD/PcfM family protein [Dehalococcoidales bacterium]
MSKFNVEIIETLNRIIEIDAEDESEALNIIHEKYRNTEIVLSSDDYIDTTFYIIKV